MTAKITIVVETDRKDATWEGVLEAISYAGSPGQKSRPVHKNDYTTEWGNAFGRYFNAPRIEGIKVATKLEVTPELPAGEYAVVVSASGGTAYTRQGDNRWISGRSGFYYPNSSIEGFLRNGARVVFEGVQE